MVGSTQPAFALGLFTVFFGPIFLQISRIPDCPPLDAEVVSLAHPSTRRSIAQDDFLPH